MSTKQPLRGAWGFLLMLVLLAGCGGGDGDGGGEPTFLDLSGDWSGRYVGPDGDQDLEATITQEQDALTITTSLEGIGHSFAGSIDTNNEILLTDAFDGETWSSYGIVATNSFLVRDYLFDPLLGSNSPDQGIYFDR
jgi:hypothetical protein